MDFREKRQKIFDRLGQKSKKELETAVIEPIHTKFPYANNGIWIMIAVPGSGKTYNYLGLATDQELIFQKPFYEFVVICSTSAGLDKTVKAYKAGIQKSKLLFVDDNELLNFLDQHKKNIKLHNMLYEFLMNDYQNPSEEMQAIIDEYKLDNRNKIIMFIAKVLKILGFNSYPCRMLLILDDFANHPLMRKRGDDFPARLRKLRHYQITVIVCVQGVKDLPRDMRRFATDFILFPGIADEDFFKLLRESSTSYFTKDERKILWDKYRKINDQKAFMRIHTKAKKVIIEYPKLQHDISRNIIEDV
jgi:hypothetical protein